MNDKGRCIGSGSVDGKGTYLMRLLELLHDPGREFTPVPFWFLNGDLTKAEIRRQMEDFAAHGVSGVVLHPRMGLARRIRYLSKSWFSYIREAVFAAADLGMVVVLYDEGMYPSGSANGQVVDGHPELASVGLALVPEREKEDVLLAGTREGDLVMRYSRGTMRGIHWDEEDGEANAPLTADILEPAAVDRFIELTHEAYYRELKEYFGSTIIGFFTDEPSILGRNVSGMFGWSHGFADDFVKAGGHLEGLTALFRGEENADTRLYRERLLRREEEVYYGRLSAWCEDHGVLLMGHPNRSDDIEAERYFHIPGQDLVLRQLGPETDGLAGIDSTMAKCSADAARLAGRRRNSNECFGGCCRAGNPWQLTGGDMKWYLDWLAVRGVNLFIPHAFYYSVSGRRSQERPPDVGPNNIWWPHYSLWADYMRRLSCLMTDADMATPAAVLCGNRRLCPETVAPLFQRQIGFQYLPESVWEECEEDKEKHELVCRGRRYRAVLGAAQEQFPQVPHDVDDTMKDCACSPEEPSLRCAHFMRAGTECWFLVNEGNELIDTELTLPGTGCLGVYDLWRGSACRGESVTTDVGVCMGLRLLPRESRLLFACDEVEYEKLPLRPAEIVIDRPEFRQTEEDGINHKKTYTASINVTGEDLVQGRLILSLEGEEMAELTVNGRFAGASFWPAHRFDLTDFLSEGENQLVLVMTGSMANRYGRIPAPYGLTAEGSMKE